jgi:PEP-CTERM motif
MTNLHFAILALVAGATAQAASISVSYDFPTLTARPGQTVTFRGTVTNLEAVVVDLNGCSVNMPGAFTTDNCGLFFTNAPLSLNPHETSFEFDMFTVTPNQPYSGPFGLQPAGIFTVIGALEGPGGTSPDTNLGSANFQVSVVPEPGTAALLLLALGVILVGQTIVFCRLSRLTKS